MSLIDILAARSVEIDLRACRTKSGAIYCLVDGNEIVYVGQTTNVEQRIALHINENLKRSVPKKFDRAFWFGVSLDDLDTYEHALIRALSPRYNLRAGVHLGKDNEVLAALGLPLLADEYANAKAFRLRVYKPRVRRNDRTTRIAKASRENQSRTRQRLRAQRLWAGIEQALKEAA